MIDLEDLKNHKPLRKEIFVDTDYPKSFLVYIIDYELKTIVTYRPKYIIDTIDLIHHKIQQFNIDFIGVYTKEGVMMHIYDVFDHMVRVRDDIYKWRMRIPSEVRNRTLPIYFYQILDYKFISENEYIELIKINEN